MDIGGIFSRITSVVQTQINSLMSWFNQIIHFGTKIAQVVQQRVQRFVQTLTRPPRSKTDYWKFMGIYFSRRFVIMGAVVTCVVGWLFVTVVYPWADGRFWAAALRVDSPKFSRFTGKVKVNNTNDDLIYEGEMSNGKPQGFGIQYDMDGNMIYKGNFENGSYSGEGEQYSEDGTLVYNGNFANNRYDGRGKLYNITGKVIYLGDFAAGQKSGKGIEYDPKTGLKTYYGEFLNDARHGNGIEYCENGETFKYEGLFKNGVYEGFGKLYEKGNLIYSGEFLNGMFEGQGDMFDSQTGLIRYSGGFKASLFDGTGTLFNTKSGAIEYEGRFTAGKRRGEGKSYDKLGSELFNGDFNNDSINYIDYLGSSVDEIKEQFGIETYRTEKNDRLILTYLSLDASLVFKVDPSSGEFALEKVILGTKREFMGLGSNSTPIERRSVMGEPFSTINFSAPEYYKTVLSNLAITINDIAKIPSDKYVMDNYFIRFYFNEGRTELKFIEICGI